MDFRTFAGCHAVRLVVISFTFYDWYMTAQRGGSDRPGWQRAAACLALLLALAGVACSRPSASLPDQTTDPGTGSGQVSSGGAEPPRLVEVGSFDQPLYVTAPRGDPRIFVVEKTGRVKVIRPGEGGVATFLDLSGQVSTGGEQGLLSIAFAPDYGDSRRVYVSYTDTAGDSRIVEYRVSSDPDRLDPASRRELLKVGQPFSNHNGGLVINDASGMLIVGLGDGGSGGDPANRAQDLSDLLGKLLRIDPRPSGDRPYGIPPDNPFLDRSGARPEIWAYGLRNPWRFAFDEANQDLYVGDVGQNRFEELNWVPRDRQAGANYGWRAYEGDSRFTHETIDESRLVRPALTYPLKGGNCAIVGGEVYREGAASLRGAYLFGDSCKGELMAVRVVDGKLAEQRSLGLHVDKLSSFGRDGVGRTYATSLSGPVFRIEG